ncbi:MAG: hypothetical protein GX442_20160 [Candidatus Riflebacteria bacterium]|nr:hypothetical protein [Candidatus Riflebacteria bacterium]
MNGPVSRRGLTLAEIVIVACLAALLGAVVWTVLASASRQNQHDGRQAEVARLADSLWAVLREDFRSATAVASGPDRLVLAVARLDGEGLPVVGTVTWSWTRGKVRRSVPGQGPRLFDFDAVVGGDYLWELTPSPGSVQEQALCLKIGLPDGGVLYSGQERLSMDRR